MIAVLQETSKDLGIWLVVVDKSGLPGPYTMKLMQHTQVIFLLSEFISPNIVDWNKQSHEADYQVGQLTKDFPGMFPKQGWCWQHLTNLQKRYFMNHMTLLPQERTAATCMSVTI